MADPYASFSTPVQPQADPYAAIARPVETPGKPKTVGAAMAVPSPRIEDAPSLQPGPRTSAMPDQQPSWLEVGKNALLNLPSSLWNDVAVPTYKAVTEHPLQTAESLIRLPVGVIENLPQPRGTEERRQQKLSPERLASLQQSKDLASAVGRDFVDAYGSENALKHTLSEHPGRVLMDASTVGTAGAALPGRVGTTMNVLSKVDPLTVGGNTVKYGAVVPGEAAASNALGFTTGAGTSSIRAAGRAGREGGEAATAFTENMRGAPVEDVVNRAKTALGQIRQERSAAYKSGMADVSKDVSILDFGAIDDAVKSASDVGKFRGQSGTAPAVGTEPAANEIVDKMGGVIKAWKALDPAEYHTPVGIDALKRTIGNLRDSTQPRTPERVAADRIYNAVRQQITDQAPSYASTMEGYAKASDQIGEIENALSLKDGRSTDTAARKLLSTTRNNVQTNYGERARLVDVLAEQDPTLPYAIAGQGMNALLPRGIVARGGGMASVIANPSNALALPAFSPRIVGETVYLGGRAIGMVDDVASALGITPARLRALEVGGYQAGRPEDLRQRAMSLRETNALAAP